MAHLWTRSESGEWLVLALGAETLELSSVPPKPASRATAPGAPGAVLLRPAGDDGGRWVLLAAAGADVRVNGLRLAGGIRLLEDRDEIRAGGALLYFSAESLARVESYPGDEQIKFCPRCRQEIGEGTAAVRCPQCGVWHHESEALPCWSYAETCALCAQATDLEAATFRWSPGEP